MAVQQVPSLKQCTTVMKVTIHAWMCRKGTFTTFSLANITSMCWSPDSQILCSSGGKVIHVWTNQVVLEETLRDLKKQLESATSEAHKVRNYKMMM